MTIFPTHLAIDLSIDLQKKTKWSMKSQQKAFHIQFDISMITDISQNFLKIFNFEHIELTQTQFEHFEQLLLKHKQCYATTKFDVGKIKVELNLLNLL